MHGYGFRSRIIKKRSIVVIERFLCAMIASVAGLGYMVNTAHDLCWFDMACMIGKERPQGSTRSGETWLPAQSLFAVFTM